MRKLLLAACVGGLLAASASAGTGEPTPSLAKACSQKVSAKVFHLKTRDRLTLYAAELGKGTVGVVLAAQHFSVSCEWVPEAKLLAARGYRVLVFNYRNTAYSQSVASVARASRIDLDVLAAAHALRSRGATKLVLVGSLIGANAALDAATQLDPTVSAVIAIAPPAPATLAAEPGAIHSTPASLQLQIPILVVVGQAAGVPAADAQTFYDDLTSPDKQSVTASAPTLRGVDLLKDPTVGGAVLQFIAENTG